MILDLMSSLEPNIQHLRIKIHDNAKPSDTISGQIVEVSATSVTGDMFVISDDRDDVAKVTTSTPLHKKVVDEYFKTHAELKAKKP